MASAINRGAITKSEKSNVIVELHAEVVRGQMVKVSTDWSESHPGRASEVEVILKIDADLWMNMLMKAVE